MKVESRIEALEQELKILKNEIQSTLLEIREQVLNHYYPELRAEELAQTSTVGAKSGKGKGAQSRMQPPAPALAPKGGKNPFSDVFLEDMDEDEEVEDDRFKTKHGKNAIVDNDVEDDVEDDDDNDDDDNDDDDEMQAVAVKPQTREVAYQQLKQNGTPKAKPTAVKAKGEAPSPKPYRPNFAELAGWVGSSVAKIGKERTNQVVQTYAESGGLLSDEVKRSIQQLISLASDEEPTTPIGNQEMLGRMVELDTLLSKQ